MTTLVQPATRSFRALGTSAVVVVADPDAATAAEVILHEVLDTFDVACSRFREDSEIAKLATRAGEWVVVSGLAFDVLSIAVEVARLTGGAVDPTVGSCMEALGYDRDFALLGQAGGKADKSSPRDTARPRPAPGWESIDLDPTTRSVRVARGTSIDVGSSAKAFAADTAAALVAAETGTGAIVSLGGDVAVAGEAPDGGWVVGIAESSSARSEDVDEMVRVSRGGLASSSPGARSWGPARSLHHIVDPRTGACAERYWVLVSAAAPTCVEANAATTAALVWGAGAVPRLVDLGYPVRLVRHDGEVIALNGWPLDAKKLPA